MKLYEIDSELRNLLESFTIDEETGEIIGDIDFELIQSLKTERDSKLEGLALFFKELSYEVDALKTEANELKSRAKLKERKMERIKNFLSSYLQNSDDLKNGMETSRVSMRFRTSEAVDITDEDKIPKKFSRIKYEPDKTAIRKAIEDGIKVRGAVLVTRNNLSIK